MLTYSRSWLQDKGTVIFQDRGLNGVIPARVYDIYEEAVEYYRKENVCCIIHSVVDSLFVPQFPGFLNKFYKTVKEIEINIHWGTVTVTNEDDESTVIKDLFCKIRFKDSIFQSMSFTRTTYTKDEWNACYKHSHLPRMDASNPLSFTLMCLGTGPINNTISTLRTGRYSQELLAQFYWELDKVVHVESLAGVPYIRMSEIKKKNGDRADINVNTISVNNDLRCFIESFVGAVDVPLGYEGGMYVVGCTFLEFALLVTNYWNKYITTFPRRLRNYSKRAYVLKNGAVYSKATHINSTSWRNVSTSPIIFNGVSYPFTVTESTDNHIETTDLVDVNVIKYIQRVYTALININFCKTNYGKEQEKEYRRDIQSLHALCADFGICSDTNAQGATTEDTILSI